MRNCHGWQRILGAAGLVFCLGIFSFGQDAAAPPQQPAPVPEGLEVSARGPVHEAFAEPVAGTPNATPVVPKKPPDPIEELPPDQKPEGNNVVWMPGYWSWDEERKDYMWISGFWRSPPPGRQWTPGHWKEASGGWQWAPGFWASTKPVQEVTYLPPPPAPAQTAPSTPAPGADYTYVPGCWVWRGTTYAWQPGYWVANRPNWVWVPAHYVWTPCGYVFVDGYWDYTLRDRGLMFAPVYVSASLYSRPGYVYTPVYVVQDQQLYGALFVRPGYSGYYFGDYFGPGYRGNYVAWCDYRVGYYRDPLFTYYNWQNRGNPGWAISIQTGYVNIYAGRVAPPPRALVQNTVVVRNTTVINNTTNIVNNTNVVNNTSVRNTNVVNNNSMLTPLNKTSSVKLQPVSMAARQQQQQAAKQVVQASAQRGRTEAQVLAKGPPPTKLTDPPRKATMNLPQTHSAPASAGPAAHSAPTNSAATHSTSPAVNHPAGSQPGTGATHPGTSAAGNQPGAHPNNNQKGAQPANHPAAQPQRRPAPSQQKKQGHNEH